MTQQAPKLIYIRSIGGYDFIGGGKCSQTKETTLAFNHEGFMENCISLKLRMSRKTKTIYDSIMVRL